MERSDLASGTLARHYTKSRLRVTQTTCRSTDLRRLHGSLFGDQIHPADAVEAYSSLGSHTARYRFERLKRLAWNPTLTVFRKVPGLRDICLVISPTCSSVFVDVQQVKRAYPV